MTTAAVSVSREWTVIVAGLRKVNLAAPTDSPLLYRVATSLPTAGVSGHRIPSQETHPVDVATGETLYARLPDNSSDTSHDVFYTEAI